VTVQDAPEQLDAITRTLAGRTRNLTVREKLDPLPHAGSRLPFHSEQAAGERNTPTLNAVVEKPFKRPIHRVKDCSPVTTAPLPQH